MSSNKTYDKYTNWRASNKPYVLAAVAAIIVFMLVAPMTEKGSSMSPTIGDGNVVIIQKKSFSENQGLPQYEDILAFKVDFYKGSKKNEHRFGRVIGLPGDIIEVKEGDVYRNDKILKHKSYEKGKTTGTVAPTKIGANKVFILCDNREDSIDSRNSEVGALILRDVRGKAILVIWPLSNFGVIK